MHYQIYNRILKYIEVNKLAVSDYVKHRNHKHHKQYVFGGMTKNQNVYHLLFVTKYMKVFDLKYSAEYDGNEDNPTQIR